MVEGLQNETQKAVSFMEEGVTDVDKSLRLAEDASSENVQLHQAVESMFAIIQQLCGCLDRRDAWLQRFDFWLMSCP
jgi:methyl-accepting chemotaxis protein